MATTQIVIAALSIACLIVLIAIVAVVRSGRHAGKSEPDPTPPAGDRSVAEWAERIRAAQPLQAQPELPHVPAIPRDVTSLGRMPAASEQRQPAAPSFGTFPRGGGPERVPPSGAQAMWPASGPREPVQSGAPFPPLPNPPLFHGGGLGSGGPSGSAAGSPPGWLGALASPPSGALSSSGRMPAFAVEDTLDAVFSQMTGPLASVEQQRLRDAAFAYNDGIRVAFDPHLDAVDLVFAACRLRSKADVLLAFYMLSERLDALLRPTGRDRVALVVDVAGLEISAEVTEAWISALRQFLLTRCATAGAGRLLLARYNSRVPSSADHTAVLQRIQTATVTTALSSQTQVFGSRDEAVALIRRLRELASVPG